MKYSVIIPTYKHLDDLLKPCIKSLIEYTTLNEDIEIFVVANGCGQDGTKEYMEAICKEYTSFKFLEYEDPLGYAKSNNKAIEIATGDYIVLFSNDVVLLSQEKDYWLNELIKPFEQDTMMGVTGPLKSWSPYVEDFFMIFFLVMISRKCLEIVGGKICEDYGVGYGEDTDFCMKAMAKGFKISQAPTNEQLKFKDGMAQTDFPVYHGAEKTVFDNPKWSEIVKNNQQILMERYNKTYKLRDQEVNEYDEVFKYNGYAVKEEEIKGRNIIDIGAKHGFFTLNIAKYKPKYTILVESDTDKFTLIQRNIKSCGITSGVGGQKREVGIKQDSSTETLKNLVDKYYRDDNDMVLKFDCGGSEKVIFAVADREFVRRFKYIYMKSYDNAIVDMVCKQGFEVVPTNYANNYKFVRLKEKSEKSIPKKGIDVTVAIPTKNRNWTTLPSTILAVCNQSYKPKHIIIYDDGEPKPTLDKDPLYAKLFQVITHSGISWQYLFSNGIGLANNRLKALKDAPTEWIWAMDDDCVPQYDVLEKLVAEIDDKVGAVGGSIINNFTAPPAIASNKIEDIYVGLNRQWYLHPKDAEPEDVDHLYSSFLFRKDLAVYPPNLSPVSFREDTTCSYSIRKKGYDVIFVPTAVSWHLNNPQGGCRSEEAAKQYADDQKIFEENMVKWGVKPREYSYVVLDNGIGDHYSFKNLLPKYLEKNKDKKKVFFVCYPEVFADIPEVQLCSIADAKNIFGDITKFSVYQKIGNLGGKKTLEQAYISMYELGQGYKKEAIKGSGDYLVISPYSQTRNHAKSYPHWDELIPLLKKKWNRIIQIGVNGEPPLSGVSEVMYNLPLSQIEKLISECHTWIGVDNFLQHLNNSMVVPVKGTVLWGVSDPKMFGYKYNLNILRDRDFLRPNQIDMWKGVAQVPESFEKPEVVYQKMINSYMS